MKKQRVGKGKISLLLCLGIICTGSAFLLFQFPFTHYDTGLLPFSMMNFQNSEVNLTGTLAHQIFISKNTISNWEESATLLVRGIVLGEAEISDLDKVITKFISDDNWKGVLVVKRYSELLNYSSSTIDEGVRWALNETPMFEHYAVPKTKSDNYFWMWQQYVLYGYKYSRELNYLTEKWNATSAFEGFRNCRISFGRAFYECNPDTNSSKNLFGTRWMNTANLANSFMILYNETGLTEALDFAIQEWNDLNTYYWNEDKSGYEYSRTWKIWEWSTINVFFNYEKLHLLNGTLDNWDRAYTDLQSRYLNDQWAAPLWGNKVVVHYEGSSQKRLRATLDAWLMLLTYFGDFNPTNQINMQKMLEGESETMAWQALLSSGTGLYDSETYRFKIDSDSAGYTDYGTAEGCMTLFLMGMSPQSGSGLMIPKRCHDYSGEPFPVDVFRFLYSDQQIIIPVYGGTTIKFLYGTLYPSYSFEETGLYGITFAPDWNSIIQVELIGNISSTPSFTVSPSNTATSATTDSSPTSTFDSKTINSTTETPSLPSSSGPQTTNIPIIGLQLSILLIVVRRMRTRSKKS